MKKYHIYRDGKDTHLVVNASSYVRAKKVAKAVFPKYLLRGRLTTRTFRELKGVNK